MVLPTTHALWPTLRSAFRVVKASETVDLRRVP